MPRSHKVLELAVKFKYGWSDVSRHQMTAISKAIARKTWPAQYAHDFRSFAIVTTESSGELMNRIRPDMDQITCIETFNVKSMGRDLISSDGSLSPFVTAVKAAWEQATEWDKPKHMQDGRSGDIFRENGVDKLNRKAAIKAGLHPKRDREAQSYSAKGSSD